ncbi:hypothetical protein [Gulosibacter sp. 10]|uniref:hypothetical protein n=1 Tax=Gulosibacter sp. 10 TaxID=1255570 RepID=UPI00111E74A2|nr:hypothetical protein [Gulosibacter sp. 10]
MPHSTPVRMARSTALLCLGAVLAGCAGPEQQAPPAYQPVGADGAWLDPGYATGVEEEWQAASEYERVCGIAGDVALIGSHAGADEGAVIGLDLLTGEQRWELPGLHCAPGSVEGGLALVTSPAYRTGEDRVIRVDPATGETADLYPEGGDALVEGAPLGSIGETDFVRIELVSGNHRILALRDREAEWDAPISATDECALIGTVIGCEGADRFVVLDTQSSGESSALGALGGRVEGIVWAADGYALDYREEDAPPRAFDFSGVDLGPLEHMHAPQPAGGVHFPLADLEQRGPLAVDVEGAVAAHRDEDGATVLRDGPAPGRADGVWAVSADGGAFVILHAEEGGEPRLVDAAGNRTAHLDVSSASHLAVMDGYLVVSGQREDGEALPDRILIPSRG